MNYVVTYTAKATLKFRSGQSVVDFDEALQGAACVMDYKLDEKVQVAEVEAEVRSEDELQAALGEDFVVGKNVFVQPF